MIPKSCRLFGKDHATKQILSAKSRLNLKRFCSKRHRTEIRSYRRLLGGRPARNHGFMSNAAPHLGRLVKHTWVAVAQNLTRWAIVGTIIALTGFGPEHWFAAIVHYVQVPEPVEHMWPSWLDVRAVIVCVGVAIVVPMCFFAGEACAKRTWAKSKRSAMHRVPERYRPIRLRPSKFDNPASQTRVWPTASRPAPTRRACSHQPYRFPMRLRSWSCPSPT